MRAAEFTNYLPSPGVGMVFCFSTPSVIIPQQSVLYISPGGSLPENNEGGDEFYTSVHLHNGTTLFVGGEHHEVAQKLGFVLDN